VGLSGQIHQAPYPRLGDLVDEIGPVGHWNLYDAKRQPELPRSQEVLAVIAQHPEKKIHNAGPAGNYDDARKRRVVAKVEWHHGELYPRVGFIVTNLTRPAARVTAFYNQRGTAEQWIKEGKNAVKWTRLSCRTMKANAVRLQLHALAYNLSNFLRTLALPDEMESWSLTTIREKVVKIGAKVIGHARYAVFQMAEVAVPRELFRRILDMIDDLRPRELSPC
jgi:hypothetical protein